MSSLLRSVLLPFATVILTVISSAQNSWAAATSNGVVEALQKKYLVTATTPDHEQVTIDGTTMSMKCAGIYSLPTLSLVVPDNKVTDGKIQPPSVFLRNGSHVLQTGDKVYITKIDRKDESSDELLRFTILTVNSFDVTGQTFQRKYFANVSFKFKRGYLDDSPPEDVEKVIEAVLAPDTDDSQGDTSAAAPPIQRHPVAPPQVTPPTQATNPPPTAPAPAPAPTGPPPTITIGESSTQVLRAMGMPLQMIDLGKKKTYVYKNMKIIFVDDKVSDVQ
jgi:hypothetical protein